jgi:hypothetical protein
VARDANTAVDLDLSRIDDRPTPRAGTMRPPPPAKLPPPSARTATLVFHGAPPVPPATPPPTRPSHDAITPRVPLEDVSSSELVDDAEPSTRPLVPVARTAPPPSPIVMPRASRGPSLLPPDIGAFLSPAARVRRNARLPAAVVLACAGLASQLAVAAAVLAPGEAKVARALPFVAATPSTRPAPPDSPPSSSALGLGCRLVGPPRALAPRASVFAGLEARAVEGRVAVAAVVGPREARAIELDPESFAVVSTARVTVARPPRRAIPVLAAGEPVDVALDAPFVVVAPRGDAARAAKLDGDALVAFRRANAVWLQRGAGPAIRLSGDARQVGAPTIAARDGVAAIAWAERGAAKAPWRVRWARVSGAASPEAQALPDGVLGEEAMAPAIAVLEGGRVLLAWTDGKVASHEVRAALVDASGALVGSPLTLSPAGANAGQPQIAIRDDGRGVVAFFVASDAKNAFALGAAGVECR